MTDKEREGQTISCNEIKELFERNKTEFYNIMQEDDGTQRASALLMEKLKDKDNIPSLIQDAYNAALHDHKGLTRIDDNYTKTMFLAMKGYCQSIKREGADSGKMENV